MKRLLLLLALAGCHGSHATPDASARRLGSASWDGWDFALGQGDANVKWSRSIYDSIGNPVDITGASVVFRYRLMNQSTPAVSNAGAVTGPAGNRVATYTFTSADTATPGDYNASFVVTLPIADGGADGSAETFTYPSNRWLRFTITPAP